jgi:hypothetical protein
MPRSDVTPLGIGRSLVPMGTLRLRLAQVLPIAEAEGSISYQLVS